jgi:elongation factor 2
LEKDYAQVEIIRSDPVVSYKETITSENTEPVMSKSQNKHNRLHGTSSPLDEKLVEEI